MFFRQLFDQDTWTYTYLLADEATGEAVLIDPVAERAERDAALVRELGFTLRYSLDTHVHADHVTGAGRLRGLLGAQTGVSAAAGVACADLALEDGQRLTFGAHEVEVRHTPGHTDGCATFVVRDGDRTLAFTGDSLLIRGCGRTDFQQGDAHKLYRSVHEQIFSLPDDALVYPGHDYKGQTCSTVGEEKRHNPRLRVEHDEATFVGIMQALELPPPRFMQVAVPANLGCGQEVR